MTMFVAGGAACASLGGLVIWGLGVLNRQGKRAAKLRRYQQLASSDPPDEIYWPGLPDSRKP